MKSGSPRVATFKAQYEETDGPANGETWCQYWVRMTTDRAWDHSNFQHREQPLH